MENRTVYRFIKSSWGIYIDLLAEATPYFGDLELAREVNPGIWLYNNSATILSAEEQTYLELGVSLVNAQLRSQALVALPLLIRIKEIGIIPTDFQPEGLACAIATWAGSTFDFQIPTIPIRFDRLLNRYIFDFPDPEVL